ncbi:origin recognition complex subunit 4 C-terminus-domain-containing protein [Aspergillus crustosus]
MQDPRTAKRRRVSDSMIDADGDIDMQDTATPQKEPTPTSTTDNATPRTGLRSSGRQRKAPQRYEDVAAQTQSARNVKALSTSKSMPALSRSKPTDAPRRSLVSQTDNEDGGEGVEDELEEEEEQSEPEPVVKKVSRTKSRSKRSSVRFTNGDTAAAVAGENGVRGSPSPDDFRDGLDDLVSMQLQQELVREETNGKEEATTAEDALPSYAENFQYFARGYARETRILTKTVVEKLNGKRLVPLKGLEAEYHKVHQLIEQTVTVGEGNSMLLLGSRGSGKTAIIETAVSSLRKEHKNEFHVVRLNGFLHTDDRLALREIWRQLGRETNTEEDAGKVTNYADTMATLLAMLSHPEELQGSAGDHGGLTAAKSIVIVLDEFDLFVTHPRQTLLYNLFDIAQARKAPLAVLGVTTKVDVTEMLEKRVKSRFSHRSVYVPLPRTFEVFSDACLAGLNMEDSEVVEPPEGFSADEQSIARSSSYEIALAGWRVYLQGLWADPTFQTHLRRIYHQTKSVKEFFTSALVPVSELHHSISSLNITAPTPASFSTHALSCPDPAPLPFSASLTTSTSPSSLPLSLLLAATRLAALYEPGLETAQPQDIAPLALSFPAAYSEYVRLLTSAKTSASVSGATVTPGRVWGRDVARESWERLVSWGLISPVGGGSGTADGRLFRVEISFEEVVSLVGTGGGLGKWWRDG